MAASDDKRIEKIERIILKSKVLTFLTKKVIIKILRSSESLTNQVYVGYQPDVGLCIAREILSFRHKDKTINTLFSETNSCMRLFILINEDDISIGLGVLNLSKEAKCIALKPKDIRSFDLRLE